MTIDAIGPTPERLRRSRWLAPETSRDTQRVAWRALDVFDRLLKTGDIDMAQRRAAEKFETHYKGRLGHDVRLIDEVRGHGGDREDPIVRHGRELAEMREVMTHRQYRALAMLVESVDDVREVGLMLAGRRCEKQARLAGIILVQEALSSIAVLYGFVARAHPPMR